MQPKNYKICGWPILQKVKLMHVNKVQNCDQKHKNNVLNKYYNNKLDPYGTDGRLFATDFSANFKVT